jgi:hypothetical protein
LRQLLVDQKNSGNMHVAKMKFMMDANNSRANIATFSSIYNTAQLHPFMQCTVHTSWLLKLEKKSSGIS